MFRRIFLFVLTNIAIIVVGTVILSVVEVLFGWDIRGTLHTNYMSLAVFALIYWFFTSFISLYLSKWMAKRAYGIQLITEDSLGTYASNERLVYSVVASLASQHAIKMPEVGIYISSEINAFATWATKNSSLVAVSSWLLDQLTPDAIEWVVAHEMAHILNGDMVTMTLLQWVINAFVIFLSRAIANILSLTWKNDWEGKSYLVYFISTIVLEILLWIWGSIILMAFSRRREFAADAGSAAYVGKHKMITALRSLQLVHDKNISLPQDKQLAAFKIDGKSGWFLHIFSSHPSLEERILRLSKV